MDSNKPMHELIELSNKRVVDLETRGTGTPILWLHSGFRGRSGLDGIVKAYMRELDKRAVSSKHYLPNLAGFGRSSRGPTPGANPYDMARDIIALIEHLDLQRLKIVGYSLGANVATIISNRLPARIDKVVLLGTAIEGSDLEVYRDLLQRYREEDWEGIVEIIAHRLVGDRYREQYLKMMPLVKKQVSSERFESDLSRILNAETRLDVFPELERLESPTLMISGLQDPFVPRPSRIRILQGNSNIHLKLLPEVGHNEMVFPRQVDLVDDIMSFWGF